MQSVSDGEMGCDRAKMAFACLAENAPKVGLFTILKMSLRFMV